MIERRSRQAAAKHRGSIVHDGGKPQSRRTPDLPAQILF